MDENTPLINEGDPQTSSSAPTSTDLPQDSLTTTSYTEIIPTEDVESQPIQSTSKLISILTTDSNIEQTQSDDEKLSRHELAAWVIDETLRGIPLLRQDDAPRNRSTRDAYLFFENYAPIRQLAVFCLVILSFFELPAWCSPTRQCQSPDGSDLFLSGIPYLSSTSATLINGALLSILIYFAIYDALRLPRADLHFSSKWHRLLLVLLVLDLCWCQLHGGYPPFRPAPFLRALLPMFYWNDLRECTFGVGAVVSPFCDVFTFLAIFTLLFGWISTLLYHDVPEADHYFGDFSVGLYSAFTSVTTADWPMQIVAILDISRQSALLFLVFIVIGVFLLFNVLLAVVYNAYTEYIEQLVVDRLHAHRESLALSYQLLTENDESSNIDDIKLVFEHLRKNKRHADLDDQRINLMFTALDENSDGNLSHSEYLNVIEVLRLQFIVELENISPMERFFPDVYQTTEWQSIAAYVRSSSFSYLIDGIMMLNIIVVLIESTMDLRGTDTSLSVLFFAGLECLFSIVYILEMFLKVASQGFDRYWRDIGNRFDFAVTLLLLLGAGYVLYPFSENNKEIVRYLVLLKCLRLLSLLADIPRFRRLVRVFSVLIPGSFPLFTFMFLSLYVFAAAGTEFFGGLIYRSNPNLDPAKFPLVDAYVDNDYWTLNFNDIAAGWHTLFSTIIVAYMTEIPEAIASTSRYGEWTKLFFMFNFVVNVLIVSNCVVAFVVDLFVMEDEQNDEDEKAVMALEKRYGTKRVKILQQKNTANQVYSTMFRDRLREERENYEM